MSIRRSSADIYDDYELEDEDFLGEAIEDALEEKQLTPSGDKNDALNDLGRYSLNKNGASLDRTSKVLAELLDSSDEKIKFQTAKFLHERHAGRLDNSKEHGTPTIIFNVIGGQGITPGKPSFLNPNPKVIETTADDPI